MTLRRGLALSAAALAWLCSTPDAFATGNPQPFNSQFYSSPTVALTAGGNTAALPPGNPTYSTIAATTLKLGDTIVWVAPTGNNWVFNGAPTCAGAALTGTLTGNGTPTLTCTLNAGAGTTTFVQVVNAGGVFGVALQGPAVAQLANVTTVTNPTPIVPITAQNTGTAGGGTVPDPAPIANTSLTASPLYFLNTNGQTLVIDLTGNGLPAISPGAGFDVTPAVVQPVSTTPPAPVAGVPTQVVSTAGFLGTLSVGVNTNLDARNGLFLGANDPLFTNGSLTGAVTATLFGDFATITSAYLVPNSSVPAGNQSNCAATAPANAIAGTINAARNAIGLTGLGNPGNPAFNGNVQLSVCLVTNGTQVIQQSNGGPGGAFGIGIISSVSVAGIATPIPLTIPNQTFASISYQGSVFFAQNVFGVNNLYPTFFRAVNPTNTAAQIWAVLTKDVNNVVPETGAGSCGDQTANTNGNPVPPACNTLFVANLTATTDPTGLSKGLLQANTGAYYTADAIAALAGTTLPGGNNKATMFLLSPNSGLQFSALRVAEPAHARPDRRAVTAAFHGASEPELRHGTAVAQLKLGPSR